MQRRSLDDVRGELRALTERIRAARQELEDTLPGHRRSELAHDLAARRKKR